MTMEWSKSTVSGAELERKRREYIEAAMDMSRRAAPGSGEVSDGAGEPLIILGKEAKAPEPIVPEAG
ncbi:MAG: hypothetical protein NC237_11805, partial [Eubacterium sp.]|nr:hypothetical protein [Eubacterium sp.]